MAKNGRKDIMKLSGQNNFAQQCIKIIAEIVVNMSIIVRKKFSNKLKNSASEIGYYSYTNR